MNNYTVYCHINKFNNKKYVGQTCQVPEKRWREGRGYRPETYFGRAIAKCGWENFEHIIIATNLSKEEADELEIKLIKDWDLQNPQKGYNLTAGGSGTVNVKRSKEYREKQSKAQKGKIMSEEAKKKIAENSARRKGRVGQYDKNNNLVAEWEWAELAFKATGIGHISDVLLGKRKSAGGYYWRYIDG